MSKSPQILDARFHQGVNGLELVLRFHDLHGSVHNWTISEVAFDNLLHDAKRLAGEPAAVATSNVRELRPTSPGKAA